MKHTVNGFNRIAGVYDLLAKGVFGKHIRRSQEYFLKTISKHKRVLILGGGSGWILDSINALHFKGEMWFVEASSEMIRYASRRQVRYQIHFVHGTEENLPQGILFDAVITNFYLDLFPDARLSSILKMITARIVPGAVWIATDFVRTNSIWHRLLLRTMYYFFRITSGIESRHLPHWQDALVKQGLTKTSEAQFYNGFIRSGVFVYFAAT